MVYRKFKTHEFNYDKTRKEHFKVQYAKLNKHIAANKAMITFCTEIIQMTNNPYIKDDPEAILLSLKDHCEARQKFCADEKIKAYNELSAIKKLSKINFKEDYYEEDLPGFKPL